MYKKLIASLILAAPLQMAFADADVGCGLGTQVWEGTSGAIPRSLAATTNGTSGNQTFGISSGTSGCKNDGAITASARLPVYAKSNLDQLASDMAAGKGESLDGLVRLYGIEASDQSAFVALTKTHFSDIFTGADMNGQDLLSRINALMRKDPALSKYAA